MKLDHLLKLSALFVLVKLILLLIVYITPSQFDISSSISSITSNEILNQILNKFIHWDNVYFNELFHNGPSFEHEWVFGPLWWRFIKAMPIEKNKFIVAVVIVNVLNYLSMVLIYELTWLKFKDNGKSYLSAVFFVLSPMGVFAIVPYSENLSNFFIMFGLYLYHQGSSISYLSSSILFSLSVLTRSNTIIIGVLFFYDFIITNSIISMISGIIMGCSLILMNYVPYLEFCPGRGEWCLNTIPSIYSFAQAHYWNVGFLKYWTSNNIFNFVISSPMLVLLYQSTKAYTYRDLKLSLVGWLHLILCVFFIHVQIVLRISSFLPLTYWYLSDLMIQSRGSNWVLYLCIWIPLQTTLFSSFLPPA